MRSTVRACALVLSLVTCLFVFCSCTVGRFPTGRWQTQISDPSLGEIDIIYRFAEDGKIYLEQKQGDEIPFSILFGSYETSGDEIRIESEGARSVYTFSVEKDILTLTPLGTGEALSFLRV